MNKIHCVLCFCLVGLFFGCEQPNSKKTTAFHGHVMTIDYHIIIGDALSRSQGRAVERIIQDTFAHVNAAYNKWNPDSEISHLNQLKAGEIAEISPSLEQFLQQTHKVVTLSEGRFDPTINPLQELWKKKMSTGESVSPAEIEVIKSAIGWNKIHFGLGYFYKDHDLTSIDLGGIAKGHCVDLLVDGLKKAGYENIYVEWGGEIRTAGEHPDKRPWHIFISRYGNPDPEKAIAHVELKDQALATSGDYIQKWSIGERQFFHIFDPKTGLPLESKTGSISSASVLAESCFFADGLATAAMLFPSIEEAEAWTLKVQEQYPEVQFWLVN